MGPVPVQWKSVWKGGGGQHSARENETWALRFISFPGKDSQKHRRHLKVILQLQYPLTSPWTLGEPIYPCQLEDSFNHCIAKMLIWTKAALRLKKICDVDPYVSDKTTCFSYASTEHSDSSYWSSSNRYMLTLNISQAIVFLFFDITEKNCSWQRTPCFVWSVVEEMRLFLSQASLT